MGSTKERIVAALDEKLGATEPRVAFVGSHPMAGSEKSGVQFAQADLFVDRLVIVTPSSRSCGENVDAIEDFLDDLSSVASPALQQLIAEERARLGPADAYVGLSALEAKKVAIGDPITYLPMIATR